MALALVGGFLSVFGAAAPAGAATASFSLSSASLPGQSSVGWQVGLGDPPATPNTWADPITLNGQIDSTSGVISGASLSLPPTTQPPTMGETPTFTFTEVHPGTATGSYDSNTGAVTLSDVLSLSFHIDPLGNTCISSPISVALSGTYDSTTQDVTLATTSSFTIPQFPVTANCIGPVAAGINSGIAGSVGNSMSLALHGQFAPGLPTTTTLAVTPPTPQPAGTSVTMTATVTDPSGADTPAGNVNFLDNGVSIGSGALSPSGTTGTATATYSTATLPGGTNQLSATYTGSTIYAASSSAAQAYDVQPAPTISADIPSSTTPGTTVPFTLTISNPASGQSYANMYVELDFFQGPLWKGGPYVDPAVSYQDAGGNWCPFNDPSQNWGSAYYSGMGTAPCGSPPSSFALSAGTTLTIPMEITFPTGSDDVGTAEVAATLYTGSCSSSTDCTAVAPFKEATTDDGTAPTFVQYINVASSSGPGTGMVTVTDPASGDRAGTTTIRQGFDVTLAASVASQSILANPTGTVQFLVDGQSAGTRQVAPHSRGCGLGSISRACYGTTTSNPIFYPADLAPGTHTILMNYLGDSMFAPASLTETFTVVAGPPIGTLFACQVPTQFGTAPLPFSAYVTAIATAPATAPSGTTVNATNVSVTIDFDGAATVQATSFNVGQTPATIDFSPSGSATAGPITFSGTKTSTDYTGTWNGMATSVPITTAPGTEISLGVTSISFGSSPAGSVVTCNAASQPASMAQVLVSGNTLTASPAGSAPGGAPVTLTDAVYPSSVTIPISSITSGLMANGQVEFFDGSTSLGTVPVDYSGGPATGTATFITAALSTGDHQLTAVWSGNGNVGPNTSNTVDYTVGTATTTALVSSANPANAANPVTYTATVTPPDGATTQPTGDVSFTSDGNPISSCQNVALSMASPPAATCTVNYGAGQSHAIVATYGGDGTYLGSASDPLTQTTLPGTNTTILSTKDPSPPGNVTFWSGVSPSSGSGAVPTGTVAFTIDGSVYKACKASPLGPGGGASCTVSFKAGTTHTATW